MADEKLWLTKYYSALCGYTITRVHVVEIDGELWPTFTAKRDGHPDIEFQLSCEPCAGNGEGFLHGLPVP